MSTQPRAALAALIGAGLLAACDGGSTEPRPLNLSIDVDGFVERGAVVRVAVTRSGTPVSIGEVQLTASPADAITALGGDSIRLNRAGPVTLSAAQGSDRGRATVEVAAPPVVFFDRLLDSNRDIYRVDLDGQNLTRLTTDAAADQDPTVAAGRVAFVSFRAGSGDIWSVPTGGGTNTRLTSDSHNESTPALSPDGQRLAFSFDGGIVSKLWTARGDGSNPARATEGFGFNGSIESSPAWAPGSSRLAFMSTDAGSADIYDFTPGSSQPAVLAQSGAADVEPAWSPDGQSLAFVSNRTGSNTDIYVMRVSTGAVTRITSAPQTEGQPAWTRDGRRLVFTDFSGGGRRLFWVDLEHPSRIVPIETGPGRAENPALEP